MLNKMEALFNKCEPYKKYEEALEEPFSVMSRALVHKNANLCHSGIFISNDGKHHYVKNMLPIKEIITYVFFIHRDFNYTYWNKNRWDQNFWIVVGECFGPLKHIYILYETYPTHGYSECIGYKLYFAETKELLYEHGISYCQKYIISKNINTRFNCGPLTMLGWMDDLESSNENDIKDYDYCSVM